MAIIRNYTPHNVVIVDDDLKVKVTFPSEGLARAAQSDEVVGSINGIELVHTQFGAPEGLPDPVEGVYLIVSLATANAAKAFGRTTSDLLLTSAPVRDEAGRIVGCKKLAVI